MGGSSISRDLIKEKLRKTIEDEEKSTIVHEYFWKRKSEVLRESERDQQRNYLKRKLYIIGTETQRRLWKYEISLFGNLYNHKNFDEKERK